MTICLIGARRKRRNLDGFSLMEMLIVVTLFSLSMLIVAQTFSSFNQLHRKIANRAIVNQDLRFTAELMIRTIRNRALSYGVPILPKDDKIAIAQPDGSTIIIKRSAVDDPVCADIPSVACLIVSMDSGATWLPLTAKRVHVEQFDVYVRPLESPFIPINGSYANNSQPFVTIKMTLRYMANDERLRESVQMQTTVSSRVYQR